jgi:hypothetical protein
MIGEIPKQRDGRRHPGDSIDESCELRSHETLKGHRTRRISRVGTVQLEALCQSEL